MHTSTPLSPLPFSLHHIFPLPSFLPVSPSAPPLVFHSPFLSYHPLFHPLSFYHPLLSLSPCFPVTFISIFCLFPLFFPFFILLRCFSLSSSPRSSSLLLTPILPLLYFDLLSPFSLEIPQLYLLPVFHPLLPPFLLSLPTFVLLIFSHSPISLSISLLHFHIS